MDVKTLLIVPLLLLLLLLSLVCASSVNSQQVTSSPLFIEYKWKYFDYTWKTPEQKKWYVANGLYAPRALTPIDVDRSRDGRTFVTIIKAPGVPASVNTVSKKYGLSGPLLEPYPDWSWYNPIESCSGIINVFRVAIDECNRIWLLDAGVIDANRICRAKLLAFDLHTDKLIFQQELDDRITANLKGTGLLVTPIVETEGQRCEDTTIYIADTQGRALIVWRNLEALRIEDPLVFGPEEAYMSYSIANESFFLNDGVLGMALSPKLDLDGHRYLVFRPMASLSVYAVDTRLLKGALEGEKVDYIKAKDVLPSQASAQAFASDGTLFYGLTSQIAIGCWNIQYPMLAENFKIAITDEERLQFTSGMKVIRDPVKPEDEYLFILTNRLQKIYNNSINIDEYNFRVSIAPVKDLVEMGGCLK